MEKKIERPQDIDYASGNLLEKRRDAQATFATGNDMKTLLKGILTGIGFAIGLLLVFYIWGQIHKALPSNKTALYYEGSGVVCKSSDPLIEFSQQLEEHAPELEIIGMSRSDDALIFQLKGNAVLADGATIIIPDSETENLRGVALRIKAVVDSLSGRKSEPVKVLSITSQGNISLTHAEASSGSPSTHSQAPFVHVVYPGESFDDIARHYGVSEKEIKATNGINQGDPIKVGSKLIIPQ